MSQSLNKSIRKLWKPKIYSLEKYYIIILCSQNMKIYKHPSSKISENDTIIKNQAKGRSRFVLFCYNKHLLLVLLIQFSTTNPYIRFYTNIYFTNTKKKIRKTSAKK